ncbi:MAG: hypothetical protein ACT4OJ_11065, partial [Bacteroidota bacterium]
NRLILRIVMTVAILVIIGYVIRKERKDNNPRLKEGRDIIEYGDSLYYIKFKIDSVVQVRPEPDERYR